MLRNVTLTAPYGHNGAFPTLEGIVRHHIAPRESLVRWTPDMAQLPDIPWLAPVDFLVQDDPIERRRHAAVLDLAPQARTEAEIADLVAFLGALEGVTAKTRPLGRPETVPSGLPVD